MGRVSCRRPAMPPPMGTDPWNLKQHVMQTKKAEKKQPLASSSGLHRTCAKEGISLRARESVSRVCDFIRVVIAFPVAARSNRCYYSRTGMLRLHDYRSDDCNHDDDPHHVGPRRLFWHGPPGRAAEGALFTDSLSLDGNVQSQRHGLFPIISLPSHHSSPNNSTAPR